MVDILKRSAFIYSQFPIADKAIGIWKESDIPGTWGKFVAVVAKDPNSDEFIIYSPTEVLDFFKVVRRDRSFLYLDGGNDSIIIPILDDEGVSEEFREQTIEVTGSSDGEWGDAVPFDICVDDGFISDYLNVEAIEAGLWSFSSWITNLTEAATGEIRLIYEVYLYSGDEPSDIELLFTVTSTAISGYTPSPTQIIDSTTEDEIVVLTTDKIMVKIYAQTNDPDGATVGLYFGTSFNLSYITAPTSFLINRLTSLISLVYDQLIGDIADKQDKDADAVPTNFAMFDSNGNTVDSTYSSDSFIKNAFIDAKGDLIVGAEDDVPNILSVGTDGHILTADSGEAAGVKWHDRFSVGGPFFISTDFVGIGTATIEPYTAGAILTGTAAQTTAITVDHPGIMMLKSGTDNNSGYMIITSIAGFIVGGNEKQTFVFKTRNAAAGANRWRMGNFDGVAVTGPANGIWLYYNQTAGTISGQAQSASGGVQTTATAFTYAGATFYRGEIVINAAKDTITFSIYTCADGALVWTNTLATIPATYVAHGVVAWNTAPVSAREIVWIDYISYQILRTLVR